MCDLERPLDMIQGVLYWLWSSVRVNKTLASLKVRFFFHRCIGCCLDVCCIGARLHRCPAGMHHQRYIPLVTIIIFIILSCCSRKFSCSSSSSAAETQAQTQMTTCYQCSPTCPESTADSLVKVTCTGACWNHTISRHGISLSVCFTGWAVAQTCCISQCAKYRKSGIFGYRWEQNP